MPETLIKEPEIEEKIAVSNGIYAKYIKRPMDFVLSLCAIIVLSPILLVLTVIGAIVMKGNPFFFQERPGKNEKIFKLIKFRTMTCEKDSDGKLLPDEERLTKYGNFIRHTSLDELPELFNILKGDMAIIGPRPLLPEYLPYYTKIEHQRHSVRPGLTGLAQINGRNAIGSWEERFAYDLKYVEQCSLRLDIKILFGTVYKVLKRSDILVGNEIKAGRLDIVRKKELENAGIDQKV